LPRPADLTCLVPRALASARPRQKRKGARRPPALEPWEGGTHTGAWEGWAHRPHLRRGGARGGDDWTSSRWLPAPEPREGGYEQLLAMDHAPEPRGTHVEEAEAVLVGDLLPSLWRHDGRGTAEERKRRNEHGSRKTLLRSAARQETGNRKTKSNMMA
jgi:hypothetical protein